MLSYKRLEKGRFRWPPAASGQTKVVLSQEELTLLLGGLDLAETKRRRWYRNPSQDEQTAA
jgi:transposase